MQRHKRTMGIIALASLMLVLLGISILISRSLHRFSPTPASELDVSRTLPVVEYKKLPFGDKFVLPNFRYVALYGSPVYPGLGALGEQSIERSITRARELAHKYQTYSVETVIPTFEIITTIASKKPTKNNDYSQETEIIKLEPWITAAYDAHMYVMLDLQPGRTDFLTQAKKYRKLLLEPHVGLALDPEWRLKKNEFHLQRTGSVTAKEINEVSNWLADLTSKAKLPQKIFLIHQFRNDMIIDRPLLDTSRKELSYIIQMDGQGSTAGKNDTWKAITSKAPKNIYFGWKNFYDEDAPLRSPADTMKITPEPYYISYQ